MTLSHAKVKNAKPADKPYKLTDGGGLYLYITKTGAKSWRFSYRFSGKQKTLTLGLYPDVSLQEARKRHQEARQTLADGLDPGVEKRISKAGGNSFQAVAAEWWQTRRPGWTEGHAEVVWRRLEKNVLPWIGHRDVDSITTREVLETLKRIEKRNAVETARRVAQICNQIFIFAVASGRAESNPASDISKALTVPTVRHLPAITDPARIGELMRAIDGLEGSLVVRCGLQLIALTFVRPGELRKAEWSEIDFEAALWTIPAERMKRRRVHQVPLSKQALNVLHEIYPLTGRGRYIFPANRGGGRRPMSENTLGASLMRLGFDKSEMVAHGFRTMASTRLHELGFDSRLIELQLAHADRNSVRAVYDRSERLDERRKMIQSWADYLDSLKAGAEVIPINKHQPS